MWEETLLTDHVEKGSGLSALNSKISPSAPCDVVSAGAILFDCLDGARTAKVELIREQAIAAQEKHAIDRQ